MPAEAVSPPHRPDLPIQANPWTLRLLAISALALLALASVYTATEARSTTDLWIGLAGGRWISQHGFPQGTSPYTYTAADEQWFNQNWGSHVLYWQLYDALGPNGVIVIAWILGIAVWPVLAWAARLRCGSWTAAALGTGLAALACRGFLNPRPATNGFLMLAGMMVILSLLLRGGDRKPAWPVMAVLPLLLMWGFLHGSFVFGYGLIVLFIGYWAVMRLVTRSPDLASGRQVAVLAGGTLIALVLTLWLHPLGTQNFTHVTKIAGSEAWRNVQEWLPAYVLKATPPVYGFWAVLIFSVVLVIAMLAAPKRQEQAAPREVAPWEPHITLYDLAIIALGLFMTIRARRFVPLFFLLATPGVMALLVNQARRLSAGLVARAADAALIFALVGVLVVLAGGSYRTWDSYVRRAPKGDWTLLDRATVAYIYPQDVTAFLAENQLALNAMTEWKWAGLLMFADPEIKLFIDGRAQQVYSEDDLRLYQTLWLSKGELPNLTSVLDATGTQAVVLPDYTYQKSDPQDIAPIARMISANPQDWATVFRGPKSYLYVRRDSDLHKQLAARERSGDLAWPDTAASDVSRAAIYFESEPRDFSRAATYFTRALQRDPALGQAVYDGLLKSLFFLGQDQGIRDFVQREMTRLQDPELPLTEAQRQANLQRLRASAQQIAALLQQLQAKQQQNQQPAPAATPGATPEPNRSQEKP